MRRAALALACVILAGCGLGPGRSAGGASVTVTDDFGGRAVGSATTARAPGGDTVIRFLERHFRVGTRYGGGFVQSIDGLGGGHANGRPVDWFYYVNGIEAPRGAAGTKLHGGDRVWWDRHDWGAATSIPAVVGAFPQPFASGTGGKRLPVRVDCAADAADACTVVRERLQRAGVTASPAALGAGTGTKLLRLVVGSWREIGDDPAARMVGRGPSLSGVFARPSARKIFLLDRAGRTGATIAASSGLLAATRVAGQEPTWLVTGTDSTGVLAAAGLLDARVLRNRFAVAVGSGHTFSLPLRR